MRQIPLLAAAALAVLASCAKTEQQNPPQEEPAVAVEIDESSLPAEPVCFSSNVVRTSVKSNGGLDAWRTQDLYIYGFEKDADYKVDFSKVFINNIKSYAPDSLSVGAISVWDPAYSSLEPFYYQGTTNYDFYGYYVDDAADPETEVVLDATKGTVSIPVAINGTQDLLTAKTYPARDTTGKHLKNPNRFYSSYAARRSVNPTLVFKHQLSRFKFYLYKGDYTGHPADSVLIEAVYLAAKYKGTLIAASADSVAYTPGVVDIDPEVDSLYLTNRDSVTFKSCPFTPIYVCDAEKSATHQIGESIMVFPGETTYRLALLRSEQGKSTIVRSHEFFDITLGDGKKFEAGYEYHIKIYVYANEPIKITVDLEPWEDGGDVLIDPDAF